MRPSFNQPTVDMIFLFYRMFFVLFIGLISNKFHYNNISRKEAAMFVLLIIRLWKVTQYIMYNIEIHKVLKIGPENKNYIIICKRITHTIRIYNQKLILTFLKYRNMALNWKKWPKMTINDLYVTYEVKVDLWSPKWQSHWIP